MSSIPSPAPLRRAILRALFSPAGLLISMALVFSSDAAMAGKLNCFVDPTAASAGPFVMFSQTDLAALDQALRAESTAARLAEVEMDGVAKATPAKRNRDTAAAKTDELPCLIDPAAASAGPFVMFSQTDLAALEQALSPESTGVRLAEMGGVAKAAPAKRNRDTAAAAETELFPYSSRVLPLLVPRPDAVAQAPWMLRDGTTQAVGFPHPMLRSPSPSERAAR